MGSARAEDESLEYAVKATYLYKLGPFIEWPASAGSQSETFKICIIGPDPFGDTVDQAVAGQAIGGRAIKIVRLPHIARDTNCQVIYLSGSPEQSVAAALLAVKGLPVLTVTENSVDSDDKGIVNFVIVENRVRFEIDDNAAAENGITISSKVLDLAVSVKRRTKPLT
jgi:hypothetical protein